MSRFLRQAMTIGAVAAGLAGCATTMGVRHRVAAPPRCEDASFPVYFKENSADLTAAALQVIANTATGLKGCRVSEAQVTGLAGAETSGEAAMTLSRARADAVAKALQANGFPAPLLDVDAKGASGARAGRGVRAPLRDRADVKIVAARP